jgi:hypothetical protein
MRNFPGPAELEALRAQYPPGTRVELTVPLDDPYAKLAPGERATVTEVDGAGDLLCRWDCGSGLKLILGVDAFKVLESPLTGKVFSQVMAIREGATCNMLDTVAVQRAAYDSEFYELVLFVEEHKAEYARLILTGHCD